MKKFIQNLFTTTNQISLSVLRIPVGLIFAAHGAQKLFAWFGGYGIQGTGQWLDSIGLGPGALMAILAGGTEFFGGLLLVLGLLTRPVAALLAFTMAVAVFAVHLPNGLFMSNNGYEYALTLLIVSVALAIQGAGKYSVDALLQKRF